MSETKIIPLGGLGQFGANATIIQTRNTCILIDFGLMFPPDRRQPGVDFYINDPEEILANWPDLEAVFITHGHEDHIGGLYYLLKKKNLPVYATPYTGALIESADPMIARLDLHEVCYREPIPIKDLVLEYIPVTHSIAKASCLLIDTPGGTIMHSGDFKLDPAPGDGTRFDIQYILEKTNRTAVQNSDFTAGIDLLMMDSTNAEQKGFSGSEAGLLQTYQEIVNESKGRIFISCFSSSLPRLINVSKIAEASGRKVVLAGRSFHRHFKAAMKTGYIKPNAVFIDQEQASALPPRELLYFITGSQGEPNAALSKIAAHTHRDVQLRSSDTIIFASRPIPGNERAIALLRSSLEQAGARVINSSHRNVHVSGHAYREELAYLLNVTKPGNILPIHGEFTMLQQHEKWLKHLVHKNQRILLRSNGDELVLQNGICHAGKKWETSLLPIDGNQLVPLQSSVLKERKDLMYSGLILISFKHGYGKPEWDVLTMGLAEEKPGTLKKIILDFLNKDGLHINKKRIKTAVKKLLRRYFNGMPVIRVVYEGTIL
ncbi:MAG: hypothetical protein CR997_08655 [Acidobacteria bacterium]|nr:MAG: hypothetical protein CR997_08655 [Acidobacteriota bacterium]